MSARTTCITYKKADISRYTRKENIRDTRAHVHLAKRHICMISRKIFLTAEKTHTRNNDDIVLATKTH